MLIGGPGQAAADRVDRLDRLGDDIDLDPPPLFGQADDETVVTEHIDTSRDSPRVRGDLGPGLIAEQIAVARAGDP